MFRPSQLLFHPSLLTLHPTCSCRHLTGRWDPRLGTHVSSVHSMHLQRAQHACFAVGVSPCAASSVSCAGSGPFFQASLLCCAAWRAAPPAWALALLASTLCRVCCHKLLPPCCPRCAALRCADAHRWWEAALYGVDHTSLLQPGHPGGRNKAGPGAGHGRAAQPACHPTDRWVAYSVKHLHCKVSVAARQYVLPGALPGGDKL